MTPRRFGFTVAAALAVAAFVALGLWQSGRAQYKEQRALALQRALAGPVQPLARILAAGPLDPATLPRRVRVQGEPVAPAVLLDNVVVAGRAGVRVYAPLRLDGGREVVLLDLGWIPWGAERTLPELAPLPPSVEVDAMLAPWPGQGIDLGGPQAQALDAGRTLWVRLDREAIGQRIDAGAVLDAVARLGPEAPLGYHRSVDPFEGAMPAERHRAYAMQWFALAAAVAVVYGVLMWRSRTRGAAP